MVVYTCNECDKTLEEGPQGTVFWMVDRRKGNSTWFTGYSRCCGAHVNANQDDFDFE